MSQGIELYAERVADRLQPEVPAINPVMIAIIIEIVLQVIECLRERQRFSEAARSPTLLQRIAFRREVRECMAMTGRRPTMVEVTDMVDAMLAESAEMEEKSLQQAFAEGAEAIGLYGGYSVPVLGNQ